MRERMTAIIAIILLLVLIAASYWYSMRASYQSLKYVPSSSSPDFVAENITMIRFDAQGAPKSKLRAERIEHFSDDRVNMVKPYASSLTPNEPVTKAQADTGHSHDGGETFVFEGNVRITREATDNRASTQLETETLTVYPEDNRMESEAHVVLTSGQDRMQGDGMIYDHIEQTIELKKNVKTMIQPKSGSDNLLMPQ